MDISVISGIDILPYLAFVGLGLLIAEFFLPTKGLLGITGAFLFVLGTVSLTTSPNPDIRITVAACVLLNVVVLGTVGVLFYFAYRGYNTPHIDSFAMQGKTAHVVDWNTHNKRVELEGAIWAAESATPVSLKQGQTVRVIGQNNLTLLIEPTTGTDS